MGATPGRSDVPRLAAAYQRRLADNISDSRIAARHGARQDCRHGFAGAAEVEDRFLSHVNARRTTWCAVRRRDSGGCGWWGPEAPVTTGRAMGDYRDLAALARAAGGSGPGVADVVIETDRGSITIAYAPATRRSRCVVSFLGGPALFRRGARGIASCQAS